MASARLTELLGHTRGRSPYLAEGGAVKAVLEADDAVAGVTMLLVDRDPQGLQHCRQRRAGGQGSELRARKARKRIAHVGEARTHHSGGRAA